MLLFRCIFFEALILQSFGVVSCNSDVGNITERLVVNTTSCQWENYKDGQPIKISGNLTSQQFSDDTLNSGTYCYNICYFDIPGPVNISKSAVVELSGRNGLVINSNNSITISSNIVVEGPPPSEFNTNMWLGGFCTRPEDTNRTHGVGPGGGYWNAGGAGHGGLGIRPNKDQGMKYGWSYGFNTSHVELIGGSSGGIRYRNSAVSCGGGAIMISSNTYIVIDATISTDAKSSSTNDSCAGGGSGGTIIIKAVKVNLTNNADLTSRGDLGSYKNDACPAAGGSGGVIAINGTIQGPVPDPLTDTNVPSNGHPSNNGEVIINGISRYRFPDGIYSKNYTGCYTTNTTNTTFESVLPDYKVKPNNCQRKCNGTNIKYYLLHEKICACLEGLGDLKPANESMCNMRCFGNYRFICGGMNHTTMYYSVYKKTCEPDIVCVEVHPTSTPAVSLTSSNHDVAITSTVSEMESSAGSVMKKSEKVCTTVFTEVQTTSIVAFSPSSPYSEIQSTVVLPHSRSVSTSETIQQDSKWKTVSSQLQSFPITPAETFSSSGLNITRTSTTVEMKSSVMSGGNKNVDAMTKSTSRITPTTDQLKPSVTSGGNELKSAPEKLRQLAAIPDFKNNSYKILEDVYNLTKSIDILSPGDLNSSLIILDKIIDQGEIPTKNILETANAGQNILNIADKLLNNNSWKSWNAINKTPELVLNNVEKIVALLGNGMKVNETVHFNSTNFGGRIEVVDPIGFGPRNFTFSGVEIKKELTTLKNVELVFIPGSLVDSVEGTAPFTFNLLKYQPSSTLMKLTSVENRMRPTPSSLVSNIIAISLNRSLKAELKDDVVMLFPALMKNSDNPSQESCRFLSFYGSGKTVWSNEGCKTSIDKEGNIKCSCNHFTNFAVLLEVENVNVAPVHHTAMHWITYLGCSISLVCLILTVITFVFLKLLASDHTMIHFNLAVSLAIAQIVFLFGMSTTENKIVCKIIAILLHYFYTAAIFWMCVEGIHLYRKIVKVFMSCSEKKKYYILGWGAPAIVVCFSALAQFDGYGTEKACWLSVESGLIWAFVVPVLVVMVVNLIILFMVIHAMFVAVRSMPPGETSSVRDGAKGIVFLLPLLGLTWLFGVLAVNSSTVVFQYIFTILNSLQGFFIFIFHCVLNSEVRAALKRQQQKNSVQRSLNDSYSKNKELKANDQVRTSVWKRSFNHVNNIRVSPCSPD